MKTKISKLYSITIKALDNYSSKIVSSAALEHYGNMVELIKKSSKIDINVLFSYIALLAVLCWISRWIIEILKFIGNIIPNLISYFANFNFNININNDNLQNNGDLEKSSDLSNNDDLQNKKN